MAGESLQVAKPPARAPPMGGGACSAALASEVSCGWKPLMQDTKLCETILGNAEPWRIARVALTAEGRVDLWLAHDRTSWPCPECGGDPGRGDGH